MHYNISRTSYIAKTGSTFFSTKGSAGQPNKNLCKRLEFYLHVDSLEDTWNESIYTTLLVTVARTIAHLSEKLVLSSVRRDVDLRSSIGPCDNVARVNLPSSTLHSKIGQFDGVVVEGVTGAVSKTLATAYESCLLVDGAVDCLGLVFDCTGGA
ncbi:hypothetical protein E6O75_ATG10349 [Venturia nashicola]|uniref:Uncharacterized protein n=1 Tax=Venturia nashicola TaxID=86259 RepID=A0A4Z1P1J7_9PEZI|nr:hypothetical protein E6O75_ATG10349 [Venturia nashicola]